MSNKDKFFEDLKYSFKDLFVNIFVKPNTLLGYTADIFAIILMGYYILYDSTPLLSKLLIMFVTAVLLYLISAVTLAVIIYRYRRDSDE